MRAVLLRAAEVVVNQPAVPAVSWLEQVLCEPVKPRDIERALQAVDRLIGARRGDVEAYAAPFIVVATTRGRWSPIKRAAVVFRIEALVRILRSGAVPEWSVAVPGESALLVHRSAIVAAASATLAEGRELRFDEEEFKRLAIDAARISEPGRESIRKTAGKDRAAS